MDIALYLILVALCLVIVTDGLKDPARIYQFPFGAAAVFLGFIVPPLFGLLQATYLPEWSLERYLFMCILCLGACWLGDLVARRQRAMSIKPRVVHMRDWLIGAGLLILVGGLAHLKNRAAFQSGLDPNTGTMVAFNFFTTLLRYGFIMALLSFLKYRNRYALILIILAALYYVDRIVLLGRRRDTVEFAFVLMGSLWLIRQWALPRPLVGVALVIAPLLIVSAGFYRSAVVSRTGERNWSRLTEADPIGTMVKIASKGSSETIAGVYLLSATASRGGHDYGLRHWNSLVFNYVPAQIFGSSFKKSLYLPITNSVGIAERQYGYTPNNGSTVTGMVDAYASFWYFGCLKFFIIGYVMQILYRSAIKRNIIIQCIYLYVMTFALHAITHNTNWFVSPWVHMSVFWFPILVAATHAHVSLSLSTRFKRMHTMRRSQLGRSLFSAGNPTIHG